jgi:hypothetical protein
MKHGTNKSEQAIIRGLGGKPHKNSGRGQKKGDGTLQDYIVDVKEAEKSFTLNTSVWAKVCTDAAKVDFRKDPALIVSFNGGETQLVVIALDVFEGLIHAETSE